MFDHLFRGPGLMRRIDVTGVGVEKGMVGSEGWWVGAMQ